jgi:hypothetical protein
MESGAPCSGQSWPSSQTALQGHCRPVARPAGLWVLQQGPSLARVAEDPQRVIVRQTLPATPRLAPPETWCIMGG